jgi:hypothetical protein
MISLGSLDFVNITKYYCTSLNFVKNSNCEGFTDVIDMLTAYFVKGCKTTIKPRSSLKISTKDAVSSFIIVYVNANLMVKQISQEVVT